MKILITGGCGFLGTNLALKLKTLGHDVLVIDNLSRPGSEKNKDWLLKHGITVLVKDVLDLDFILSGIGHDVIYHLAGQVTVTNSVKNPIGDFKNNAYATITMLHFAHVMGVKKFIYSSTNKVYGEIKDDTPVNEKQPLDFKSPYGCSKGCGDQYTLDYAKTFGLNTTVLRQSCIYGDRQFGMEGQGWISWFADRALKDKELTIYGDGKQVRDILYVDDWVDVAVKSLKAPAGSVYNIGGGKNNALSLMDAVRDIEEILNKKIKIKFNKPRTADQPFYVSDITKAKEELSWEPKWDIHHGLLKLIKWQKSIS